MSKGGTELSHLALMDRIPDYLKKNIDIVSRPSEVDSAKKTVLWVHDLPAEMTFLENEQIRDKFDGIVFVSSWQQFVFHFNLGVAYSESCVIRNAIVPIPRHDKPDDGKIRLVYHPTPHRGLELLVPTFIELCKDMDYLHLDVFSNFDIYGWSEYNKEYEYLYQQCRDHPNITYHGTQPNDVVRRALQNADIFAYPCIWRETSCIAAMEAMSAGCAIVAPDYAALPETLGNFHIRYDWIEDPVEHCRRFKNKLIYTIENIKSDHMISRLRLQKEYADQFYSWENRIDEWINYLSSIDGEKVKFKNKGSIKWI